MSDLKKLLSNVNTYGPAVNPRSVDSYLSSWGRVGRELANLLRQSNGFYAFESALHVFRFVEDSDDSASNDLVSWNRADGWIDSYAGMADDRLYFAEDIFGNQFAIAPDGEMIVSLDPETAECEVIGRSVQEWIAAVLADIDLQTGFPLAHDWQVLNGALTPTPMYERELGSCSVLCPSTTAGVCDGGMESDSTDCRPRNG